jgi:hypothetical protein
MDLEIHELMSYTHIDEMALILECADSFLLFKRWYCFVPTTIENMVSKKNTTFENMISSQAPKSA